MKKYLFCLATLALGLTACDNYFDEKYMGNGDPQISVVKTYDYTLLDADYVTIANNKTNKEYAANLDTIPNSTKNQDALARIATQLCFNNTATADMYVPAFIYNKYPQLDPGSVFNVTYLTYEGLPDYILSLRKTIRFELTDANYKTIWGNETTKYLTPATISKLWMVLPQVDDDACANVVYQYSSKEPEAGGQVEGTREEMYIFKDGYAWEPYTLQSGELVIVPEAANGQTLKYLHQVYPYAQKDDKIVAMSYNSTTKKYGDAAEYIFDGEEWIEQTGKVEETLSFLLSQGWKANLSTYYKQAIAGDGNKGKIVTQDFDMEDGITYIWAFDNLYGMKGTAYKSGPHYGEGWFVTPAIKLKKAQEPALSFDMAMNYGPADETRYTQATVWVSTDYAGDVRTATWTQLPWNTFDGKIGFPDSNSWTFYNSGRIDLSAWKDQKIYIGFRYKSEPGQTCSTWEVKNILVNEPEEEETE